MSLGQNSSTLNHGASIVRTGYSFNTISLCEGSVKELENILEQKIAPNKEIYEKIGYPFITLNVEEVDNLKDEIQKTFIDYFQDFSNTGMISEKLVGKSFVYSNFVRSREDFFQAAF